MVIAIFGESCTGKSTLAQALSGRINAKIYSGKDYLRLAKSQSEAEDCFRTLLRDAMTGEHIIYVISEPEHMTMLPEGAVRVSVTAPLSAIKERFARRMGGKLPAPVEQMLERKHGCFDGEPYALRYDSSEPDSEDLCAQIIEKL